MAFLAPVAPAMAALPQQSATFDLAATAPNPLVHGGATGEQAGASVAALGDLNGDGLDDMLVGAPLADANGRTDSGSAYVIYGRDELAARTNLGAMSGPGVRIDGGAAGDRLGGWVARAGDVDGDGRDDLVVGAALADPNGRLNAGAVYVITGAARTTSIDASRLGDLGYRIDGAVSGDRAGSWVDGGGDVDGDRRDDVVVAAPQADPSARTNAGSAWVVRGRSAGAPVDLAAPGADGFRIDGGAASDGLAAAAIVPDATGDGRADVLAGVPGADPSGRAGAGSAWLVTGGSGTATVDLAAPDAGARIDGAAAGDALGTGVRSSPDVTGDATPELLLGAPGADPNGRSGAGSLYLLPARSPAAGTDLLANGTAPLRIDGAQAGDGIGVAASGGGDLNDDSRADLAVGASRLDANGRTDNGGAYVLRGGSLAGVIDLAAPPAGATRGAGASSYEYTGTAVAWAGDVNGDGRDDLLSGAPRADITRTDGGAGYVLMGYGTPSFAYQASVEATAQVALASARPTAVRRTGVATYSISPALPAGVSIDRATGAIAGTPDTLTDQPTVHTLTLTDYAGSAIQTVTLRVAPAAGACANERPLLTTGGDVFSGSVGGDVIRAGNGDDSVDARGGDDCVYGDAGDDTLTGAEGADKLYGGTEHDTLHAGPGDDSAWGEGGEDTIDGGSGRDVLTGEDGNDRIDGGGDADEIHGGDGVDELSGGADDDSIWAGGQNDFVDAGAGDDRVSTGAGRDSAHGGTGADMLAGDEDDDDLFGGDGSDELHGGAHQDELRGGDGNDVVLGDDGQDLVDGELGDDVLSGGAGFDHLTGDQGADLLAGGADDDILDGGAGDDALDGGPGDDRLLGGAGDDVVTGGDGRDRIEETAGRDRVEAGAGNDEILLRRGGGATVGAGAGNDKVVAFNGRRDTIICGAGRDTAYVDRADKVAGCEKRVNSKPKPAPSKRKKRKKSSRAAR